MNLVTVEDLEKFKVEFLEEIKKLLGNAKGTTNPRRFLKSNDVMSEFKISQTKLYEMRRSGQLPCMKSGGQYLYSYDELLEFFKKGA